MRKVNGLKVLFLFFLTAACVTNTALAQVSLNLDIMSRYVWRGADFGNSPSFQPEISYSAGGFEIGTWAAVATTGDPAGYEVDFFASYTFETGAGDLSLMVTDYTFPVPGVGDYFSSDAHFIEAGVGYSGIAGTPLSFFAGMFLTNDDDNSMYLELGWDAEPIGFFIGMTPTESAMYGTSGAAIINTGISTSRTLKITDSFEIELSSSVILNPYAEDLFFLVGFSL